mmetsp:Transcript_18524/g.31705  ORF Transcript_18524/g.31705 Transcript_18524/m.31705 type:complete len:234 (+) Transcript_18524:143-844(+)
MKEFIEAEKEFYLQQSFNSKEEELEYQAKVLKRFKEVDTPEYEAFLKTRQELLKRSTQDHFSNNIKLNKRELIAEKKLSALRDKLYKEDSQVITGYYYDKLKKLHDSEIFDCLNKMPKPGLHHIHLTASCPVDFLVDKLCYYDFVYFSEKDQMFKISKKGCDLEGYVKVNDLRKYWSSSTEFDQYLKDSIVLKDGVATQEHHEIWKFFQPKFMMTMELYHYAEFFEQILMHVC